MKCVPVMVVRNFECLAMMDGCLLCGICKVGSQRRIVLDIIANIG